MKAKFIQNFQYLNLNLLISGYLLISFIPDFIGLDNRVITIPFRGICLFCSILIIYITIKNRFYNKLSTKMWVVIIFWILFLIRIFYDLFFSNLNIEFQYDNKFEYIYWSIGVGFIPMLSSIYIKNISFEKIVKIFYWTLFIAITLSFFIQRSNSNLDEFTRLGANQAISVILYGHLSCSLCLLSIFRFRQFNNKIIPILSIIISILGILNSGTRSSFFALILCVLIYYVFYGKINVKKIIFLCLLFFIVLIFFNLIIDYIGTININFANRFALIFSSSDQRFNGRDLLIQNGISQFSDSPVFGSSFVLTSGFGRGYYPHNSIVEAFMALGIIGGTMFLLIILWASRISINLFKTKSSDCWIALLFFQYLIYSFSSMALYKHQTLWILIMLLFVLKNTKYKQLHE